MSLRCAECGNVYKNQRSLSSHISKYHRRSASAAAASAATPALTAVRFGSETIEPMLRRLTTAQLRTLLLFPEEALTSDLPNLVWFNLDYPANSTVTDAAAVDPVALLRASLHHFKKVMDAKLATLTPVQQALVRELVRCVEEGREIKVSPHCPYYDLVEGGVLSVERMAQAVARTVHENLALPREDWVRTEVYARECLDDSS